MRPQIAEKTSKHISMKQKGLNNLNSMIEIMSHKITKKINEFFPKGVTTAQLGTPDGSNPVPGDEVVVCPKTKVTELKANNEDRSLILN